MKNFKLNREDVLFTFIDIQDKLLKAMYNSKDIVKNGNIIHVRNAPSPAATSCLSIGNTISELI